MYEGRTTRSSPPSKKQRGSGSASTGVAGSAGGLQASQASPSRAFAAGAPGAAAESAGPPHMDGAVVAGQGARSGGQSAGTLHPAGRGLEGGVGVSQKFSGLSSQPGLSSAAAGRGGTSGGGPGVEGGDDAASGGAFNALPPVVVQGAGGRGGRGLARGRSGGRSRLGQ
jgi:hypothetical protein